MGDCDAVSSQGLTTEQRERAAQQKQQALARLLSRRRDSSLTQPLPVKSECTLPPQHASENAQISSHDSEQIAAEDLQKAILQMSVDSSRKDEKGKIDKRVTFSLNQMKVLEAIARKKSVFVTGPAGTGKSYLLESAIRILRKIYGAKSVFVTASTGLAACELGGITLHSFAGIGLGLGDKSDLARKVKSRPDVWKRWKHAKALIIDEISMIDGELFDKLDYIARDVRDEKSEILGGLQLIVTGDFFQLPPVNPENPHKYFAFQADCWSSCFDLQIELTHVFRQSNSEFVAMLNEIRKGCFSPTTLQRLQHCLAPVNDPNTGIMLTRLYPRKVDVRKENLQHLNALESEKFIFLANDFGKTEYALRQLDNVIAEKVLHLCVGAQVMLIKNLESGIGLINGARGVVVDFLPVRNLLKSETRVFTSSVSPSGLWPVVQFVSRNIKRVVAPECWNIMEGDEEIARRWQIPLILGWALSVHKCQGMTLDRVETDISKAFDYGMVYVALSRVKSMDGLRLIGFDPSRIKVHPKIVEFYKELQTEAQSQQGCTVEGADSLTTSETS